MSSKPQSRAVQDSQKSMSLSQTRESMWIAVHLPSLEMEVFVPHWQQAESASAVVVLKQNRVIAMSAVALQAGVRFGMRRGGVQMLIPEVQIFMQDSIRESAALSAVALALLRYTPQVSIAEDACILLDIGASIRLFGGLSALRQQVRATVNMLGYSLTTGSAPTAKAAWLFARNAALQQRQGQFCLRTSHLFAALDRLPVTLLNSSADWQDFLQGLACHQLADLRKLPRSGLQRRCGKDLITEIDQVYSLRSSAQLWVLAEPEFHAKLELPDRLDSTDALFTYSRSLLCQLLGWLNAQKLAVKHIRLELQHERGRLAVPATILDIHMAVASWQETHLLPLFKEKLGNLSLPASVITLMLSAPQTVALEVPSDSLFPETVVNPANHQHLLTLLVARLGASHVLRPGSKEDHRPEIANQWISVMENHSASGKNSIPTSAPTSLPSLPSLPSLLRPTWLLAKAIALEVRRHKPYFGSELNLISPAERIEAGWWSDQTQVRDYFVAISAEHVRYWIYRERPSHANNADNADNAEPAWFLHGIFG